MATYQKHKPGCSSSYSSRRRSLGQRHVPADAITHPHLRAVENFNISNVTISDVPEFVRGMVDDKEKAAALANKELGVIPSEVAKYIIQACISF
ncbi:hypothetical protein OH492_02435 [Vibrio chagasii]|nr:hypothetical protein [Vibrio chagasii]